MSSTLGDWRTFAPLSHSALDAAFLAAQAKHGPNSIGALAGDDPRWLSILVEEVGEAAHMQTYATPNMTTSRLSANSSRSPPWRSHGSKPSRRTQEGTDMSDLVKLSARLPGNTDDFDGNGLDHVVDELIETPGEIRLALVWYDVSKITDNTDAGTRIPTARVRRIEPLAGTLETQARKIGEKAHTARTGKVGLTFGDTSDGPELDLE